MKPLCLLLVMALSITGKLSAQSFSMYAPGLAVTKCFDSMQAALDPADTGEGRSVSRFRALESFWLDRVMANDANASAQTGENMFTQYFTELNSAIVAKQSQSCGNKGKWECIGPLSLPTPTIGKVDDIWVNPADSNHILAATLGGLFKTTNGGANWTCVTDNAVIAAGIMGISGIAVHPTNTNIIYLGTSGEYYKLLNTNSLGLYHWIIGGAGILKSTDGGQSWTQIVINDEIERVQKVYFSLDGSRLYAFADNKVYTTSSSGTPSWQNITPNLTDIYDWTDLAFVPGTNGDFFISGRYLNGGIPTATIWRSPVPVPSSSQWSRISTNFTYSRPSQSSLGEADMLIFDLDVPDPDSLFVIGMAINDPADNEGLFKYDFLSATPQWTTINPDLPPGSSVTTEAHKFYFAVSRADKTNNNNLKNIYFGSVLHYQSFDNGQTFVRLDLNGNSYVDVRAICLQSATNTFRGSGDRVYFANDGGVCKKMPGYDITSGTRGLVNLNGYGLACGQFWGIGTSEHGGLLLGGTMHTGKKAYEPEANPKWIGFGGEDAYTAIFDMADRTRGYGIAGFGTKGRAHTINWNNRVMGAQAGNTYPPEQGENLETPLAADNANNQYIGIRNVWENANNTAWVDLQNNGVGLQNSNLPVRAIAFSPYYHRTGYILQNHHFSTTTQGFYYRNPNTSVNSFTLISNVPGTPDYPMTNVTCDPRHPERVWVSLGGINADADQTQAHNKVRYSPDGGITWYNVDKGLPIRMPVTDIIFQEGSNNIYAATDVGIYYCDFSTFDENNAPNYSVEWECFSKGANGGQDFPNCYVTNLKINHCEGKLYASTYGRSIWSTEIVDHSENPVATDIISSNTTWSATRYIMTGVRVATGNTLTISGSNTTIYMPKSGIITVEPGATLIVNDATITNGCEDCMWQGIYVLGDNSLVQNVTNQGVVKLNNATLKFARSAIVNFDASNFNLATTGGIVEAYNTTFYNCRRSVVFGPYIPPSSSSGYLKNYYNASFSKCKFRIDDNYKNPVLFPFKAHVTLEGVPTVRFAGCEFYNHYTGSGFEDRGIGIQAIGGAGVRVVPYNTSILQVYGGDRGRFRNLKYGVSVHGFSETNWGVEVASTDFDSCGAGVWYKFCKAPKATDNIFLLGKGETVGISESECLKNIGILSEESPWAVIEDNYAEGNGNSLIDELGIVVKHSTGLDPANFAGDANQLVYFNHLEHVDVGVLAYGNNIHTGRDGLRIYCNKFENNANDIAVYGSGWGLPVQGVYPFINGGLAAGNTFLNVTGNQINNGLTNKFDYIHRTGGNEEITAWTNNFSSANLHASIIPRSCYSRYSGTGTLTRYHPWSGEVELAVTEDHLAAAAEAAALESELDGLIDGGSTVALQTYISGLNSSHAVQLRDTLMALAPYVTISTLKYAAFKNILSAENLVDVLEANPDMLYDEELLRYLANDIPSPLSSTEIDGLELAAARGERSEKESQLAEYDATADLLAVMMINNIRLDSVGHPDDSLDIWYQRLGGQLAQYDRAAWYACRGDLPTAKSILEAIPGAFGLTGDALAVHEAHMTLRELLADLQDNGQAIYDLGSTELATIEAIAEDESLAGSYPWNTAWYLREMTTGGLGPDNGPARPPFFLVTCDFGILQADKPGAVPGRQQSRRNLPVLTGAETLLVYPNPASGNVNFDYQLYEGRAQLTIANAMGMQVYKATLYNTRGRHVWDTRQLPAGVYMYRLAEGGKAVKAGKVVIAR